MAEPSPRLRAARGDVPERVERLVEPMLAKEPDARLAATDLLRVLDG